MTFKSFILAFGLLLTVGHRLLAQPKYSKIQVERTIKGDFTFAKNWDYSWEVFKDDSTGVFTKNDDEPLTPADTAHLFYTASCTTNIQGGYEIRYCFADKTRDGLVLTFSDGLPAYASEFYIYIKADSFYFRPRTIYPVNYLGEKITYEITRQKLTLNKNKYLVGDMVVGYVDMQFIETVSVPKKGNQKRTFYLKGYIRTPLKQQ